MDHRSFPFQSPSSFLSDGSLLSPAEHRQITFRNLSPPPVDVDGSLSNVFSTLNLSPSSYAAPPPFFPMTHGGEIGTSIPAGEGFVHRRLSENIEALQRQCSYGFDLKSNFSIPPRFSTNFNPEITDNKMKFMLSDDYKTYCDMELTRNQNQNYTKSQNQSQNYNILSSSSLRELRGKIYALAKDQNGCRLLQAKFERPTIEEIEMVLSEVMEFISDLMKDQFGNYLVQKLIVVCNDDQKMRLLRSLIKVPADIILVCMNPHGTRAVQKLLENLNDPIQVKLIMRALYRCAAMLANDPNGHHVIQYCLVHFHSDINRPILNEIANECYKIATDRSGCCVLQACVEHSHGEVRTRIVSEIMANSLHLAEDPFGNYVLQHMVGLNIPEFTALLVSQLRGNFAALACNKYGSNVVEKCLNESEENVSTRIILELIGSPNSSLLLVDPYANFVIQSALKVSKGFAHECLRSLISKNMSSMRSNLYGKKILEKFEKKRGNFAYS